MLVFAFQIEIWIAQNFNFTELEDFCLSFSWKYRFLQNVNHTKGQSKTNKYCKFHVDLTRRRLSKSRFKKWGMVPKKTVSKHLNTTLMTCWNLCLYYDNKWFACRRTWNERKLGHVWLKWDLIILWIQLIILVAKKQVTSCVTCVFLYVLRG